MGACAKQIGQVQHGFHLGFQTTEYFSAFAFYINFEATFCFDFLREIKSPRLLLPKIFKNTRLLDFQFPRLREFR